MKVDQLYTSCLAQGAYFIESEGEAIIIDPLRETQPYLDLADERKVQIKYIFETHFHADFVSGHLDLSTKTDAPIIYGPGAKTAFEKIEAKEGQEFKFGKLTIRVLHTPGHTPESTCYLLLNEENKPHAIFTGDTLFIGDVGRPDLAQKGEDLTQEDLAAWLFDSLRNKIMTLPDEVIIYPAHGAGSACGKNMSSETQDTLGNQKKTNYALRADMTKEEFIKEVNDGLQAPPKYFSENAALNKKGYDSIDEVMARGVKPLHILDFVEIRKQDDVLILDVRDKTEFVKGHIPGSIFIGLDGSFAPWVGALIPDINQKLLLVVPEGKAEETVTRLARVGFDHAIGYLEGGLAAWTDVGLKLSKIETIDGDSLESLYINDNSINVLDVRKPGEFEPSHLAIARNFPLDFINSNLDSFDDSDKTYVHCRSGYRSTVACSILQAVGYKNIVNVIDSFDNLASKDIPTSNLSSVSKK